MARSISVFAPTGLAAPTLELYTADVLTETITLTEYSNARGHYIGVLTAAEGNYVGVFKTGTTVVGVFGYCRVYGINPEAARASDVAGVPDGLKLRQSTQWAHDTSTDTAPMTLTEN